MPSESSLSELLRSYRDALDVLDDSLKSLHALVRALRSGEHVSGAALDHIEQQCTAAAVSASTLRKTLEGYSQR